MVRPWLEYANSIWLPRRVCDLSKIEKLQMKATKYMCQGKDLLCDDRLRRLKLPTLNYRRICGDMIELCKIITGKYDPNCGLQLYLRSELVHASVTGGNYYKLVSGAGTYTADTANAVPLLTQARPGMRYAVLLFGRSVNIFNQFWNNRRYFCHPAVIMMQLKIVFSVLAILLTGWPGVLLLLTNFYEKLTHCNLLSTVLQASVKQRSVGCVSRLAVIFVQVWEHKRLKVKDWKAEIYYEIGPLFHIAIVKVLQLLGDYRPPDRLQFAVPLSKLCRRLWNWYLSIVDMTYENDVMRLAW